MGIDIHALQLLKHNQKTNGKLGRTITLGRLSVLLGPKLAKKWVGTDQGAWCEDLLMRHFGATEVDSIDNSHYEGAKIIFDYNQPVPKELHQQYDAVIDFGCSEHIFNVAQVFKNTADICKIGGRILHILPADNFCGHGFYQFTPEFFLSIYSNKNGYRDTEIFLSDLYNYKEWHKVSKPEGGERINIKTRNETYILVITKKNSEVALKAQQSDYQHIWNESQSAQAKPHKPGRLMALQEFFKFSPSAIKTIVAINNFFSTNGPKKLCSNRHLSKHKPDEI
jgi:SAM-dependent methyltransferase